jgi:hypothetical protein
MSIDGRPQSFVVESPPPFTFPEIRDYEEEVTGKTHHIHCESVLARIETPEWGWTYRGKVTFCGACGTRITDSTLGSLRAKFSEHRRRHCGEHYE